MLQATLHTKPANAAHRSTRKLARHMDLGATTIRRVWQHNDIKTQLAQTFTPSRNPRCEDKLLDVVGLYLNPPERALVLCCDEKSQIQAPNRTPPGQPMKTGRVGTVTLDLKRHGSTTLFAALNTLDGTVISMFEPRLRHEEWLRFLKLIDRRTPKHLNLHLIEDNCGTHSRPDVQTWLGKHPCLVMHFTPTSAPWLNMVERFFRDISKNCIKRDSFTSVAELELAIDLCIADHNAHPKPFIWTSSAKDLLAKVTRAKAALALVTRQLQNRSAHHTRSCWRPAQGRRPDSGAGRTASRRADSWSGSAPGGSGRRRGCRANRVAILQVHRRRAVKCICFEDRLLERDHDHARTRAQGRAQGEGVGERSDCSAFGALSK
jgi:hypothetical protein